MLSLIFSFKDNTRSILILALLLKFLLPSLVLSAEGPVKPEATKFEPVDTSDLVNGFTGDFSYNLPLLSLPGPNGGWALNLNYHPTIGPSTEATMVGLGWSINPGVINRFVNGYPDDFWGAHSESSNQADASGTQYSVGVKRSIR